METSILTKSQTKEFTRFITYDGKPARIKATVRYEDDCGNGHNSFAITGDITLKAGPRRDVMGGCIHDEIAKYFPELKPFIKWHFMSSDGPMHYLANSLYHASTKASLFGEGKEADLDSARSCAIWPEAELEDFTEENLVARLPQLLQDFQADLVKLDLIY